jgi:hypothetical protein
MLSISPLGVASLVIVASLLLLVYRRRRNSRLPYPPGPKGYPLVGNVFDVPQGVPLWKAAMSIGGDYGEHIILATRVFQADIGLGRF